MSSSSKSPKSTRSPISLDGTPEENDLKLRRTLDFARALMNYVDDVIGYGPERNDYITILKRDVGPMSVHLLYRILEGEDRIADFGDHWRRRRRLCDK